MNSKKVDLSLKELLLAIGNKIKEERERQGYKLEDMDALCDIDPSAFSKIERGIYDNITLKTLIRISIALKLKSFNVFGVNFPLRHYPEKCVSYKSRVWLN
ncbi:helix-turn-helix transcriptional regulator [Tamlana crocina]